MLSTKGQRRVWSPRASVNYNVNAGGAGGPIARRSSLPLNTSFRGTYTWGGNGTQHKQEHNARGNGTLPSPREAYCTVEEIQLGKRQSKSPIMGNNGVVRTGTLQSGNAHHHHHRMGSCVADERRGADDENHYEDGEEADEEEDGARMYERTPPKVSGN